MKPVEAELPADITITVGIKVPVIVDGLAEKVSEPEGFVSEEAQVISSPAGSPIAETSAVSLVD